MHFVYVKIKNKKINKKKNKKKRERKENIRSRRQCLNDFHKRKICLIGNTKQPYKSGCFKVEGSWW